MDTHDTPTEPTELHEAVIDLLKHAESHLAYVAAWANLDAAERDSLSTARAKITQAIQELTS